MNWNCTYQPHLSEVPNDVYRCAFITDGIESDILFLTVCRRDKVGEKPVFLGKPEASFLGNPEASHAVLVRRRKKVASLVCFIYDENADTRTILTSALEHITGPSLILELIEPSKKETA